MKVKVINLDNKAAGEIELADAVFGAPVRPDIMHRTVRWQLAKRQAGTHKRERHEKTELRLFWDWNENGIRNNPQ